MIRDVFKKELNSCAFPKCDNSPPAQKMFENTVAMVSFRHNRISDRSATRDHQRSFPDYISDGLVQLVARPALCFGVSRFVSLFWHILSPVVSDR